MQLPPPPLVPTTQPSSLHSAPSPQHVDTACSLSLHSLPVVSTQPQVLPEPHTTDIAQLDLRIETVANEEEQIQDSFVRILVHTKIEFSKKPLDFLSKLSLTLTTLPYSDKFKRFQFLRTERRRIISATSVDEIFTILDKYWNYSDYALLQHLVDQFGEGALKKEMSEYVATLEQFERSTTIQEINIVASNSRYRKRHVYAGYDFSTVTFQLPRDPAVCTLYEVRLLKESLEKRSSLEPYVLLLKTISPG